MGCSPNDIRKEHEAAIASLTPAQRRALDRVATARRAATFNHHRVSENLTAMFEAEAKVRNDAVGLAA